ncbi:NDP-sugar epimerase, includes UDP-GlcNAc-inverting 4,6-dehydratase FlaA1 and capsular polysaccharide biosynthesis protein EpsC [Rhizobium sp. RU33A]|uniref:polysaccharide biosynthesis protein n=1 Tax=Rhizobium sp. RU33A TaxID=1907413 RepID=UPI000954E085|nr:nucleoside-diphosphate sugar epimerase/dehydratase [Rhizobium sp. RU33A]SIR14806.1 NDP-sugar epimerase, includes UDP-GlcNAc-inverting 4,6-dehydratase FlaA1 and capsular polysaccharide biosynthesis protein EpsC [Rhizobium sp. RU33A]
MRKIHLPEHPLVRALRDRIVRTPRSWKRVFLVSLDMILLLVALWGAYALRLSEWTPALTSERLLLAFFAPVVAIPIFVRLGLYRSVIRYLPEAAIWTIIMAMAIATMSWVIVVFLLEMAGQGIVPRSVPLLYFMLGTIIIGSSRFAAKWILNVGTGMRRDEEPILIYGTGPSAALLARALKGHGNRYVMGLVDDDAANHGRDVAGYRVFPGHQLPSLIKRYGIREIVLNLSSLSQETRHSIVSRVTGLGVKVRSIPDLSDIVDGRYIVNQIREIEIDELLGRSFVPPDRELLANAVTHKTVMVTGAGGSIGSELCRLISGWKPEKLVLLEANEFALYSIEQELSQKTGCQIVPILGSVTDERLVKRAISSHSVSVVYHAAAHKHVPLLEANTLEGIRNNVFGTLTVAKAAACANVESFVLISSDKAVRPTNVMGATKRWAELIVRHMSTETENKVGGQTFCAVRFGNVIGSNGSVVPLFKQQIAKGGPITVTDPDMTRYFMSIPEAAELIVQAGALSSGGDVFLLDMGEPIRIGDLAENMIRLAGFNIRRPGTEDPGIGIEVVGKRPGEKQFEELFYDRQNAKETKHPKILRADASAIGHYDLPSALKRLSQAVEREDENAAREILFSVIDSESKLTGPTFARTSTTVDVQP